MGDKENKKEELPLYALPVMHPLTISLLKVPADGLHVTAIIADGEPLALRLERNYLDLTARALLANQLSQPYPSISY